MITEILLAGGGVLGGSLLSFFAAKKIHQANSEIYIEQAKAKAKVIEHEAELALKNAKIKAKELELGAKAKYEKKLEELNEEFEAKFASLEQKDQDLNNLFKDELRNITLEKDLIKKEKQEVEALKNEVKNEQKRYEEKIEEADKLIEKSAGMTKEEARDVVLRRAEEEARSDIAHIVRKYESEAKREAQKRANYIIAQATTRYAGDFAAERLINTVNLPSDDLKGRIIGKEGRNIKALEMTLGVDVIIDDTPNVIILSSFNLYRRAIATKVIEELVADGRIQPARIEDVYQKVSKEFDQKMLEEGENIIFDLGITDIHPEIVKLIGRLKFRASYGQNALGHSLEVANLAGIIAAECGGDEKLAKRAGILHDIGKALTHEFAGSHVDLGADICKRYKEHPAVINAIYAHHGHEEPTSIESAAVCTADVLSAARPGARREVLEAFLKRVQDIEAIATSKEGVRQAYAINAGREIRVIANAKLVNDDESVLLAKEIAKEIEAKVQYPGDIKVNVIRELRAVDYAR
ncbi:MAG: ribonuclease Y [Campylobacteraceae bacterium 4484_4]|nr:MAG: ribonuclease Y [Campylobacteraceae bacterium 4484_4]